MVSKQDIQRAKEVDLTDLVMQSGAKIVRGTGHVKISCPFHGPERVPSCAIYPDHYYCFGCNENGDIIDFVQKVEQVSFEEAVTMIIKLLDE